MKTKREITERQTNERYSTRRRKCRTLRACIAQSRSDIDSAFMDFISKDVDASKQWSVEQSDNGINIPEGKIF